MNPVCVGVPKSIHKVHSAQEQDYESSFGVYVIVGVGVSVGERVRVVEN